MALFNPAPRRFDATQRLYNAPVGVVSRSSSPALVGLGSETHRPLHSFRFRLSFGPGILHVLFDRLVHAKDSFSSLVRVGKAVLLGDADVDPTRKKSRVGWLHPKLTRRLISGREKGRWEMQANRHPQVAEDWLATDTRRTAAKADGTCG